MFRKAPSLLPAVILLAALLALIPQAAFAAPKATSPKIPLTHCIGSACDNVDPYAGGCVDSTVHTIGAATMYNGVNVPQGVVEIRFSDTCSTAWVRTTSYIGPALLRTNIERHSDFRDLDFSLGNTTVAYGNMLYIATTCGPPPCTKDQAYGYGEVYPGGSTLYSANTGWVTPFPHP